MREGDSLYSIGQMYNVDYRKIAFDNKIPLSEPLVVGQTIIVLLNNETKKFKEIEVNGYAFSNIDINILNQILPFLTYLSIFSYSINYDGSLNKINDDELISIAKNADVAPVMVITNIGLEGRFDSELAHYILNDDNIQEQLIDNVLNTLQRKGYRGLNVDFEYIYPEDEAAYINFLNKFKRIVKEYDYILSVSVAPKTSEEQKGILYEAHDYERIGKLADIVIIMTYEWGYSGGPAMAVAPVNKVEEVLSYAVEKIPSDKIMMGIPNYGYDWTLPYQKGILARSVGNYEAVNIARNYNQSINYNYIAQSPYFYYYDLNNIQHEVWFEDARSIQTKLELVLKYNILGVSYWTLNRFFPQNYLVLNKLYKIKKYEE